MFIRCTVFKLYDCCHRVGYGNDTLANETSQLGLPPNLDHTLRSDTKIVKAKCGADPGHESTR